MGKSGDHTYIRSDLSEVLIEASYRKGEGLVEASWHLGYNSKPKETRPAQYLVVVVWLFLLGIAHILPALRLKIVSVGALSVRSSSQTHRRSSRRCCIL